MERMRGALGLAGSLALVFLILGYPLVPVNAVFNFQFNAPYGAGADAQVSTGGGGGYLIGDDRHGGDANASASAAASGSDTSGTNAGSGSAAGSADAVNQKLGLTSSVACSSSCNPNPGNLVSMASNAEGVFYDSYTIKCTGTCNSPIDLEIAWTMHGTFDTILNRPDSFVSLGISFSGTGTGGATVQGSCFFDYQNGYNTYGCPPTIENADPNAVPLYSGCADIAAICPGTTTFSVGGTAHLGELLSHYGIGIAPGDTYRIVFDMSGHVVASNPGESPKVDASHTASITVFSNTPGVTIVSAAQSSVTSTSTSTSTSTTQGTGVPEFPGSAALLVAAAALLPLIVILRGWRSKSSRSGL
jgi:hypothetical protein